MSVLGLLASAVLTEARMTDQPFLNELRNSQDDPQELLLGVPEPMVQVAPVHQLEAQLFNTPFKAEQSLLQNRVEALETRVSNLEAKQFSPTAILEGEGVLGISGVSGKDLNDSVVFQNTIELKLNISFTGKDVLEIGLESGNAREFSYIDDRTFEGQLDFISDTDGRFEISELSYEFPIGERTSLYLSTNGSDLNDFNPFFDRKDSDSVFKFGSENPINNLVGDAGLQLDYDLTDELGISFGYFSGEANNPKSGAGLFNGNQSAFVQLEFEPIVRGTSPQESRFLLGFTYIHTYNNSSLATETGSLRAQINLEHPVIGNSYGVSALFSPSSKFSIGGWVGLTHATVIDVGNAHVWNYALTLIFPDLGKEDNLLYVVIGQEPRLTGTDGFMIDAQRRDPDTSFHIELFYSHRLSENLSVTPGIVWITAPNHNNNNPDIVVFTVKTTFKF